MSILPGFSSQLHGCFSISVVADEDNVKDILLTSPLMVSWCRQEHPSDREDEGEAARGPPQGATPTPVGEGEVVVKKQALKRMK